MTNRVIKFRGLRVDGKGFAYGNYVNFDNEAEHWIAPFDSDNESELTDDWHLVYPETVGQFTGMKDWGNGDIYEGDVMKFPNEQTGIVKYEENACQFRVDMGDGVSLHIGLNVGKKGMAKVVGNIHQDK